MRRPSLHQSDGAVIPIPEVAASLKAHHLSERKWHADRYHGASRGHSQLGILATHSERIAAAGNLKLRLPECQREVRGERLIYGRWRAALRTIPAHSLALDVLLPREERRNLHHAERRASQLPGAG